MKNDAFLDALLIIMGGVLLGLDTGSTLVAVGAMCIGFALKPERTR